MFVPAGQASKRGKGGACKRVLAIAVVLEDHCAVLGGPAKQRRAPVVGQAHAERCLAAGRDICEHTGSRVANAVFDAHAMVVDTHIHDARAGGEHHLPCADMSGVLHPYGVVRPREQAHAKIECLLRAAYDGDLIGRHEHGAGDGQMLGDRDAQGGQSCRIDVVQRLQSRCA